MADQPKGKSKKAKSTRKRSATMVAAYTRRLKARKAANRARNGGTGWTGSAGDVRHADTNVLRLVRLGGCVHLFALKDTGSLREGPVRQSARLMVGVLGAGAYRDGQMLSKREMKAMLH